MASIYDIAKAAGVSAATVSLIMNNKGDNLRIAAKTQQKVRELAKELGYVPNVNARKLMDRELNNVPEIGMLWSPTQHPIFLNAMISKMNEMKNSGKIDEIEDTIQWLDAHGILHCGAGMNLDEARKQAIFQKDGIKIGVLSFNCTGPAATHAGVSKAGGAYVKIYTNYELGDVANPGGPPERIQTFPEVESLERMREDIEELRGKCDILTVYFHKGIVHKPVELASYEKLIAHMAVDAGADVVFSSHSHLLHGIERYKGRTIYHGLGNGIAWVPSLSPTYSFKNAKKNEVFDPRAWAEQRISRFGFIPDPDYPTYPFHPDAVYTIFAKCVIQDGRIIQTGCIPCMVGKDGASRVVSREDGGGQVFEYLEKITRKAGLNAKYEWLNDEIVIR